jgi:hypothetical protein
VQGRMLASLLPVAVPTALLAATLAAVAPATLVQDTWMTLVAGRELAAHGLPSADHLTVMAAGRRWVDQQWLAQVVFYEASRAGFGVAVLVYLVAVVTAFALCAGAARHRGASAGSILLAAVLALAAAPWGLQLRAQALALPLFALTLLLLARDPGLRRASTLWLLPVLCLWANIHGSVTLGALIVLLCALAVLLRQRRNQVAAGLLLSPLCILASPYAPRLPGYYRLLLVDPPFHREIVEWQRTTPSGKTALFFVVALGSLVLAIARRRRLTVVDWIVLAVTLASALDAIRGIVWFAFASLAVVPPLVHRGDDEPEGTAAALLAAGAIVLTAAALVLAATRTASRYESRFPAAAVVIVRAHPGSKVLADSRTADWLLWEIPELRGRIAYDVRFELLTSAVFARIPAFYATKPGWQRLAGGYDLVLDTPKQVARLVRSGGWRQVYRHGDLAIAERTT